MTPLQQALFSYAIEHRWPTPSQDDRRERIDAQADYDRAWEELLKVCGDFKKVLALEREKNRLVAYDEEDAFLSGLSIGLELGAMGREVT